MKANAIEHLRMDEVARMLGHSVRWVQRKAAAGELEVFRWAANDVTVSRESVVRLQERARVRALEAVERPARGLFR
jgi:hypothetical protein